ncbi:MAG: YraN family protein [Clostridia bacterium]|nr:YraN family protein [Clostridia bacterium]MBR0189131.1 YraN family protein [Clostridia bacterium]
MQFAQKNFYKKLLGRVGENQAVAYLKKQGFKIAERNYKNAFGEIDIIAKDGEYTVFIEVKTRSNDGFGAPAEAVDIRKRRKYGRIASAYLIAKGLSDTPCRFDVVEIEKGKINHVKDAFCT